MIFFDGISGIYKIQSIKKQDRIYIGMSKNICRRWNDHLYKLRKNEHYNWRLQEHYDEYGEDDLQFSIITGCDIKELKNIEQYYMDVYEPYFNQTKTNGAGFHWSYE